MIFIAIVAVVIAAGVFNPWTGLFGKTLYVSRRSPASEHPEPEHRSFRLTKGR